MNYFELYGLQRSGTTWLKSLLELNFDCSELNSYHKHTLDPKSFSYPTCVIFKSPYTWVESIVYREPADLPVRFPKILEPGNFMIDNSYGECNINLENLVDLYCSFYDNYSSVADYTFIYETLLDDTDLQIKAGENLDLIRRDQEWLEPPLGGFMQEAFTKDMYPYYKAQKPEKLSNCHIEIINNLIPKDFWLQTNLKYCS